MTIRPTLKWDCICKMRRGVAIIAALIATLVASPLALADVVWIPMPTKVGKFKKECKEHGLDLYGQDDSIGQVEDFGTKLKVVTHRWLEQNELDIIMDAAVASRR